MNTTYKSYPNPVIEKSPSRTITLDGSFILPVQLNVQAGMLMVPGSDIMYKSGKAQAASTGIVTLDLYKNHSFGVGDTLYDGATSRTITAIDTTADDHDTVTLDGVVTITLDEVVYSTDSGAVASSGLAVVTSDITFESGDTPSVAVADKAVLDLSKMPYFWAAAVEASDMKAY